MSSIAEKLNFWPYVKHGNIEIYDKKKEMFLEDVFESFIGVTKMILENHFGIVGVANQIIYDFIFQIFDQMNISLELTELFDSKTILKELFDNHESEIYKQFGSFSYEQVKEKNNSYATILKFQKVNLNFKVEGNIKAKREQEVSQIALKYFKDRNFNIDKKINIWNNFFQIMIWKKLYEKIIWKDYMKRLYEKNFTLISDKIWIIETL